MPTSREEAGILFIGGPKNGERMAVARPLPSTIAFSLEASFPTYSFGGDYPITCDVITYEKQFFRILGRERVAYVLRGMPIVDSERALMDILHPLSGSGLAASQAPVYPEFMIQSATMSQEAGDLGSCIQAELISPIIGNRYQSILVAVELQEQLMGKRMTIWGVEGVVVACNVSALPNGFMTTYVTLRELADMEDYPSTGIVVSGIAHSIQGEAIVTTPEPEPEPEPLGNLVPLRKPGEAARLRRIILPK